MTQVGRLSGVKFKGIDSKSQSPMLQFFGLKVSLMNSSYTHVVSFNQQEFGMTQFIRKKIFEMVQYDGFKGEYKMTVKKLFPSFIPSIRDELKCMIEADDYMGFEKKCESTFYYKPVSDTEFTSAICVDNPRLQQRKILEIKQKNYDSTTVIEALFHDKQSNACKEIIDMILVKDDGYRWCAVLWGVFLKSGLADVKNFFEWDEEMEGNVLDTLKMMHEYAQTLFDKHTTLSEKKYVAISTMIYEMENAIGSNHNPLRGPLSEFEEPQKWFLNLSFKLSLRKLINEDAYLLSEHRGYKRLVVNLMSILFTLGTANLVNRLSSGEWLFFNKTTTTQKAEEVEDTLLLNTVPM